MKINPFVYGLVVLVVFFGVIGVAKATNNWSVSGKLSATGEKIAPTGTNPDEIKGWMTLADVSQAYKIPVADILAEFDLPADTAETTQIKSLESDAFSTSALREWLKTKIAQ